MQLCLRVFKQNLIVALLAPTLKTVETRLAEPPGHKFYVNEAHPMAPYSSSMYCICLSNQPS